MRLLKKSNSVSLIVIAILITIFYSESSFQVNDSQKGRTTELFFFPEVFQGAKFANIPISEAVEKQLQSEWTVNGLYLNSDNMNVKVFSSAQFTHEVLGTASEIFQHTPDACWIGAGWERIESTPSSLEIRIDGLEMEFQRRVYQFGANQELCYYGFLKGGKSLSIIENEILLSPFEKTSLLKLRLISRHFARAILLTL